MHGQHLGLHWSLFNTEAVILLQIVMVSPGAHLGKNHESQLKNNEFEIENARAFIVTKLLI